MRLAIIATALSVAACSSTVAPASPAYAPPTYADDARDVNAKTVAFVRDDARMWPRAFCSGVWVGAHEILTAHHCVYDEDEERFEDFAKISYASWGDVEIPDAKTITVRRRPLHLIKSDKDHDLALLYADAIPPHAIVRLSTRSPKLGMPVQVSGHPLGFWWTYSKGEVSGYRFIDDKRVSLPGRWLFTTAAIGPGNSGGGLFDENGDLLGICHGHYPRADLLNVWIPLDYVEPFLGSR